MRVAIVGAGPAGLALAKQLKDRNIAFDVFERDADVGGVWNIQNRHSVMYESAHTISSKTMTEFSEFPMPTHYSDYVSHHRMLDYLRSYVQEFKLLDKITFDTKVEHISYDSQKYFLKTSDGKQESYDHVAIASGHASLAYIPESGFDSFQGRVIHSSEYKEPSIFLNKRVLVVGAGNSGCDIACDAVSHAERVSLSIRRGYYFIPKFLLGMPADVFGETSVKLHLPMRLRQIINQIMLRVFQGNIHKFGFPKPDHRFFESHPIINELLVYYVRHGDIDICADIRDVEATTVNFIDGKKVEFDVIVLATGYKPDFSFLDAVLVPENNDLHLNLFSKKHYGLSFLGFVAPNGGVLGLIESQAIAVAKAIALNKGKTDFLSMIENSPALNGGIKYLNTVRHRFEVDLTTYQREINKQIKQFEL